MTTIIKEVLSWKGHRQLSKLSQLPSFWKHAIDLEENYAQSCAGEGLAHGQTNYEIFARA